MSDAWRKPRLVAEDGAARAAPEDGSLAGDHAHRELPQPVIDPNTLANRLDRPGARVAPARRCSASGQIASDLAPALEWWPSAWQELLNLLLREELHRSTSRTSLERDGQAALQLGEMFRRPAGRKSREGV
jgi:hypothetical protein